jgi:hypothetical protein
MSVALSEVCGKSEGKIFKTKYRPVGILLKCLRYYLF